LIFYNLDISVKPQGWYLYGFRCEGARAYSNRMPSMVVVTTDF
jgi:hypothetical protein